jgi:hypothetical protein
MKVTSANIERAATAFSRKLYTDLGMPCRCSIHKCKRDGACSGPLVVFGGDGEPKCLATAEDLHRKEGEEMVIPACCGTAGAPSGGRVTARAAAIRAAMRRTGDFSVVDPIRTVTGRKWTKIGKIPG